MDCWIYKCAKNPGSILIPFSFQGFYIVKVPAKLRAWGWPRPASAPARGAGVGAAGAPPWPAALMRTTEGNEKFQTFQRFKDTGRLVGSVREAKPSVQCGQYRVGHFIK